MDFNHTQQQSSDEQARAQALSLKPARPPLNVPGYEPQRFLGAGAYGEVWVGLDRTTGRQVAIKFYAHQGGLDWSILSREVEKLAFLSADRYVVQLLDVGWEADPPYYVMEYIEQGSLEDLLKREGKLSPGEAVALFRDVAIGLLHAHGKGVLHCDLKPANVLLDQDGRPRLADFGQSRLSHEQTPALGTLFYMAPEQADLQAVPDVRWDVYALGALLYAMLTGAPPYRSAEAVTEFETATDLEERLARYRQLIETAPKPSAHRQISGVDRELADIVDNCLAVDRQQRYANVQEVLDALAARARRRARRPLVLLGFVGPALLLAIVSFFAWSSFATVMDESDHALRNRALESNQFAARYVAKTVTNRLEVLYRAVEELAASYRFHALMEAALDDPTMAVLRAELSDVNLSPERREELQAEFLELPARRALQKRLEDLLQDPDEPNVASWFVTDPRGLQLARAPEQDTVGRNFAWRTYFHGGSADRPEDWRPQSPEHIKETNLSAVFYSQVNDRWTVTISTPVETEEDENEPSRFLGVLGLSVDVRRFVDLQETNRQFAVLVDWRDGPNKGLILQHKLFEEYLDRGQQVPERFLKYRLNSSELPDTLEKRENYVDPLARDPAAREFHKVWLAGVAPVAMRDGDTGWLVIVQESYDAAIGRALERLKQSMASSGLLAAALIALLSTALWAIVIRSLGENSRPASTALHRNEDPST